MAPSPAPMSAPYLTSPKPRPCGRRRWATRNSAANAAAPAPGTERAVTAARAGNSHANAAVAWNGSVYLVVWEEHFANGDPAVDLDFELHTVIGTTTGNPYFSSFLEFIGGIIIPRRTILIDDHEHGGTPYLARIQAQHEAIIAAIAKGDAGAARRAMRRHLAEGRDRYRRLVSKDPDEA